EEVNRAIAETTSRLQYHRAALREWHTRLFVSSETVPDAVKVRLDELDSLARQAAALSEARRRQAQAQTILDDLVAQSHQVAALLEEPAPAAVDDFTDRLRVRLIAARAAEQERGTLIRDRRKAADQRRRAA